MGIGDFAIQGSNSRHVCISFYKGILQVDRFASKELFGKHLTRWLRPEASQSVVVVDCFAICTGESKQKGSQDSSAIFAG